MNIRSANAGKKKVRFLPRIFESYTTSDVDEWRRETGERSLYKYLYKPLFVTLIVNKNENTVCITSVFRDR